VDVVVTDKKGAPVAGLTREDFTVTEDGAPQEIASFEAVHRPAGPGAAEAAPEELRASTNLVPPGREPASFVIVFDELHLTPAQAVRARTAVASFLDGGTASGDVVALVGTAEGTRWTTRVPEGTKTLQQVLERLRGKRVLESVKDAMTPWEAMRIDQERDPIVTDQVMRRFITTGEIRRDSQLPNQTPGDAGDVDVWRSLTQARARQVYARNSLLDDAERLTRPLLVIHGLADDNVVVAHTLRLSSALVAAGRPHEVLPLSGVTHMTPQDVVEENKLVLQVEWLQRHLGVDPR